MIERPEFLIDASKLITFVGGEDDPELMDILSDRIANRVKSMTVDQILEVTVNFAHTLSD